MENKTKEKIYNFILRYIEEYGYAPSIRDICRGLGLKSTSSVHSYLKKLQEDGKIEMRGNLPRTIRVTDYIFTRKG
ncbi:hypothetical protein C818_03301 [Lachnospiraceae bacterium MD308]|nr:hypothetical protein C818_03301 [Lachnospiraceae bacterium MD308]